MAEQPDEQVAQPVAEETSEAQFRLVPPSYAEAPAVYSNFVQGTISPQDLTLYFGWYGVPPLAEPPTESVDIPIRPVMAVSIPLTLIHGVIRVLQSQVAAWEASTGQPFPEDQGAQAAVDNEQQDE